MNGQLSFIKSVVGLFVITTVSVVGSLVIIIDALSPDYDVPWPVLGLMSAIVTFCVRLLLQEKNGKDKEDDQGTKEENRESD